MSPHVANFTHELLEMAKATERLPYAEQELSEARHELNKAYDTIQRLELRLIERASEIDSLNQAVRQAEVAKEQAETMFLEADDRTMRALDFIKATFGNAGSLIQALEPPRPEPVKVESATMEQALADPSLRHDMFPEDVYYQKAEPQPIKPTPDAEGSVPVDPTTAPTPTLPDTALPVSSVESESLINHASEVAQPDPTPVMETSSENVSSDSVQPSSDPEPTERWSHEWWAWKDRQPRNAAE